MKKASLFGIIFVFLMCVTTPAMAMMEGAGSRLYDAGKSVVTSPMHIPKDMSAGWNDSNVKPLGAGYGLVKGMFHMVYQLGHGVFDVVTFPFDFSK